MSTFDVAVRFLLKSEGAESDDPQDPGGYTKYGVSQRAHPDVDVRHLTERAAINLYRARYWDAYRLERLPSPMAVALLDGTVQHGRTAIRILQHMAGVEVDGLIGPVTLAAVYRMDPAECLTGFCSRRAVYYANLSTFGRYGLGWMRRLFALHAYCRDLAA